MAVLVLVGGWLVGGVVQLGWAAAEARDARSEATALREAVDLTSVDDPGLVDRLDEAAASTRSAERRAESWWTIPWRLTPVVGRQVSSFRHLTDAGATSLEVVSDVVAEVRSITDDDLGDEAGRLTAMARVRDVTTDARVRIDAIELGPDQALLAPLAEARAAIDDDVAELATTVDTAARVTGALHEVLAGPSTYLVLAANNAQMHNGQGMFLSAGLLQADEGRLRLGEVRSVLDVPLPDEPVALPADLQARWGHAFDPNTDWRHLGMSHRFAPTAEVAAEMWRRATGTAVDGVIALDPVALAAVLAATGPVVVDGDEVSAETAVRELLIDQYEDLTTDGDPQQLQEQRRDRLGAIAAATFDRLRSGVDPVPLARHLADPIAARHLLVWSAHADHQRAWSAAGVDGELDEHSLLLSLVNRGGNKLDPYLEVRAHLDVSATADGAEATVRVVLTNTAPVGLPRHVQGPYDTDIVDEGEYLGVLTLTVPEVAGTPSVDGAERLAVSGVDGPTRVTGVWVRVDRGTTVERTFRFRLADGVDELRIAPSARVPATTWIVDRQRIVDDAATTVAVGAQGG
ncbi:MAG TPA: DUF4012 domain-containing protein [Acidimicrobiales bacterium]|nr:DUF4012 domain-containing protein [Acidimicrobiales bacterium]